MVLVEMVFDLLLTRASARQRIKPGFCRGVNCVTEMPTLTILSELVPDVLGTSPSGTLS